MNSLFFCVVFAANAPGAPSPLGSHVWASWLEVRGGMVVDRVEINWGHQLEKWHPGKQPGMHFDIGDTVKELRNKKWAICSWVLQTNKGFMDTARAQRDHLILYKVVQFPGKHTYNCIHAVSGVAGRLHTGLSMGIPAGQKVVNFFIEKGKGTPVSAQWVVQLATKGN